jgi:anti-anti-sigma factor
MEIRQSKNGNLATMSLSGRFDFNDHRTFKEGYGAYLTDPMIQLIDVDMRDISYLDSSALGMLLVLREKAIACNKKVSLKNPNPTVLQILDIANFAKLFTIG